MIELKQKDEPLTYEELTELNRKQEEYIKELEKKIEDITSETAKCCLPPRQTYEELECERDRLLDRNRELDHIVFALEKSLGSFSREILSLKDECEYYKEENYKLREKLYDK